MEISAAGVITYAPEFDTQLGPQAVVVEVSDGIDVATEDFVLTVAPAPEPDPLVIDIDVPDAYVHPTKGPIVAAKKYDVIVTFSDNSITEGKDVWARWSDVNPDPVVNGTWVKLTKNVDYTEFTGELDFGEKTITECEDICIQLKAGQICCDPIITSGNEINLTGDTTVKVDSVKPCASFTVTFKDCAIQCPPPGYVPGASMSWTTACLDDCGFGFDCCGDNCSGVGDWTFTADYDICGSCDVESEDGCAIVGAFECGCLSYLDVEEGLTGIHEVLVSIKDNVGNEFTDTWTLHFDTDNITSIDVPLGTATAPVYDDVNDEWTVEIDYGCEWDDCDICFPSEV